MTLYYKVTAYITCFHAQYILHILWKMNHHEWCPEETTKALSNFLSECFWDFWVKLSMLSSSLFFTLSGSWHGAACAFVNVHVCGPALVCMPVWLTHSAVNSVILGGPAVQGLHWHPTLGFKTQTNTGTQTHTRNLALQNTHRSILKYTCINTNTDIHTHSSLALLRLRFSIFSSITFHCYLF